MNLEGLVVGFAVTGSFCTLEKALAQVETLVAAGINIIPIMSEMVWNTNTRFGSADYYKAKLKDLTGHDIIASIKDAEPIGPKKLLDALIIAPCTGNTMAKIANGITDSSVAMATKAHLRNSRPVIIAISTNDALGVGAQNIARLMNVKNIFFVPFYQDDPMTKQTSMISDFAMLLPTLESAMEGKQLQPIILSNS